MRVGISFVALMGETVTYLKTITETATKLFKYLDITTIILIDSHKSSTSAIIMSEGDSFQITDLTISESAFLEMLPKEEDPKVRTSLDLAYNGLKIHQQRRHTVVRFTQNVTLVSTTIMITTNEIMLSMMKEKTIDKLNEGDAKFSLDQIDVNNNLPLKVSKEISMILTNHRKVFINKPDAGHTGLPFVSYLLFPWLKRHHI